MEIKVHGQGEFPPTTKVGLFTYGWLHDSLVYSSNYTDLARKNFTWTFPANAAFTDGQYIVKVFRPRKNWLRKVYGSSMSFRLLGTGIQYRRVSMHKRYVEKIIPFFVAEENGHMIVKVDLSSNFGRSNSKIEFRVFDADSTEEINGLRMKLISKSRNLALYNDKNVEMELEVKSDVITFELPLAFEGSLSRIYIEASTRGLFGRRLIIYRVSVVL